MIALTLASYNIHKAIGSDGRRDPARIMAVIDGLGADVLALQEVDLRLGSRASVLDRDELARRGWQVASVPLKPASLGWHGNALLVREGLVIERVEALRLPALEPRGALCAVLRKGAARLAVTSMHLDLSGLRRRAQLSHLCRAARAHGLPAVMMGDCNTWSARGPLLRGLAPSWTVHCPGPSFPARRPMLGLDRFITSPHWHCEEPDVLDGPLVQLASDHRPIRLRVELGLRDTA